MESIPSQVSIRSVLPVAPATVWDAVTSPEGLNREMKPWLSFVAPEGIDLLRNAASGEVLPLKIRGPLGLPLGRYPLRLVRFEEGRGFLEQTWMLPVLLWQHERIVEPENGGTVVTDRLGWRWKASFLDRLFRYGVRSFFRHRHRQLRRWAGS